jgi:GTP pyrophosphokinase
LSVPKDFEVEHARSVAPLAKLGADLESLISGLLETRNIRFHRVEHRVKSADSAAAKIARKMAEQGESRSLETFTDLLGLRIITYFQDEVDAVAQLIAGEFAIDAENSVDKSAALDPDRFGYKSIHYVAELSEARLALPENRLYAGIKFEIQIRSILQHAWAEIEHDLGYKAEAVPRAVKRRFSALAAMLELADGVFVDLRQEVSRNQEAVRETIENGALSIEIDQDSLAAFVRQHKDLGRLDKAIARAMNVPVQRQVDDEFIGRQAANLVALKFASIEELSDYLSKEWDVLKIFINDRISHTRSTQRNKRLPLPKGITLYYVGMLRHIQDVLSGKEGIPAYTGMSVDSLRHSLDSAANGNDPLPGVLAERLLL